jgi:hypothetical protein
MEMQLSNRITKRKEELGDELRLKLSQITDKCTPFWQQSEKLDAVLLSSRKSIPKCKLLYAVECHGVQISSNILPDGTVDVFARGYDLSSRPYMLNKDMESAFSLSPVYLSRVDRKPCITAMHQVINDKGEVIGCIAADFDIDDFQDNKIQVDVTRVWRQIKGDPAIRQNLFQQERVNSAMDQQLDQVHDIIVNLVCKRGIFHAKLHYSSSRATLWPYERPYEYQLHVLDEIIDPDVCLAYSKRGYPEESKVMEEKVKPVFDRLKDLRNADETIYLRSGSLNIINAMVGLTFSCDGSHYMPVEEFLDKPDSFWFGVD